MVLNEILEANLEVELSGAGDNVLSSLGDPGLNARVGLGETLESFDELGQIVGILDLDGDLDDGRDTGRDERNSRQSRARSGARPQHSRELHDLHVVSSLRGGESSRLEQELIDTDETDNVSGGAVLERVDLASHHEHGALNRLDKEVVLLAGDVVGALDANLGSSLDGTSEDTAESVEATLVGSGNLRRIQSSVTIVKSHHARARSPSSRRRA